MLSRRNLLLSAGAGLALTGCATAEPPPAPPVAAAPPPPAPPSAEQQLASFLDDLFEEALKERPELVTSLGLDKGERAAAKSQLHDASLEAVDRRRRRNAEMLVRLKTIDRSQLSGMSAVNYDSMLYGMEVDAEANARFRFGGEGAGSPYVLSQIGGAWSDVPDFLSAQHTVETREDAEAYVARMEAFARVLNQEVERVRHDAGLGVIPPDYAIKGAIAQMKVLRAPADKAALIRNLTDRTTAKGIPGDWRGEAGRVYEAVVVPAIDRQIALLESLLPRATHDAGVWKLPDGEAYYALALRGQTTSNMTPQEVHQLGLEVTRELHARADVLFRKIGYTKGGVGRRYDQLYKSRKGVYPNTDAGKAQLIAELNKLVAKMEARLPEQFATLHKAKLEIRRIPKETEQGASTHYSEGSLDGSRPGIYWINLRDTAEAPYWFMPTTTIHEGVPGHHMQLSIQREADLPMIRRVMTYGAYVEGWALYTEQVAQEMGFYEGDTLGELGYIHDALLRSGRLVTDTGIHHLRWSREKAIATLSEIDGDPPSLSAQEIERYSVWPGQACSYMVGKVTLLRLREKAKAALGTRYDPRAFHDAVLLSGSMPLTVLEARIDQYIAAARA
ncbi:DUF885 domain-containing protein [Phenylobacterium sp.]|jgi:uncharacterized protein (DUF885 family)|uniref:DUF885 domain-containing protein n=1 Tax=Phenylobacterium sp. TaxID=1871053 RepID=UPI002F9516A7